MYEGIRICCRCQQAILPGEPYDTHAHDRASGPPLILFSHKDSTCKRQPHQEAPVRSRAR
ncbi:hypothetical protein [Streptomyces sp. CC219B]|uniref:hypothetical protein n=1 Tax=Streptomyces sp. CC219B TaxID=3044574 RepID=UPI0024A88126|nr:hypothetical protein [Streptomyces sp. CC219B]